METSIWIHYRTNFDRMGNNMSRNIQSLIFVKEQSDSENRLHTFFDEATKVHGSFVYSLDLIVTEVTSPTHFIC